MNISPSVQQSLSRIGLQLQKHAPAILTTLGVGAVVTSGVLAAKNTLKLEKKIDESQARLQNVNELIEQGEVPEGARTAVYVRNVVEVSKLYFLPVGLMAGGIVCILSANNILNKRNAALAAAYNGLAASYKAYRGRVREELGEEREKELYYGERREQVTGENGKKQVVLKPAADGEHVGSPTRFIYDVHNPNWTGFHDENLFRLQMAQNMHNDLLRARGHVFLHEVLDTLGIQRTPASAVTGWIFDTENPDHEGDNYIEFNIRDYQSEYGYIMLDFNIDGTIFDKI